MSAPSYELRTEIAELIYRGAALLDERRFYDWLELTATQFQYRIGAYSPEIRKEMTWLEHDRAGLRAQFELLGKHHRDHALWFRQAVLQELTREGAESVRAITRLVIYQTAVDVGDVHVESGSTRLFAVARYHDRFVLEGGRWLLAERLARLDTRQLGIGTHDII
ncbi:MAG TPA: nuclear transport factor 2 family protein [Polyangiales bacterium]|nr:nuclear transport factor 2 family protein [Polyangiales bacterium]